MTVKTEKYDSKRGKYVKINSLINKNIQLLQVMIL